MDTALPQKFSFILDRNLAKANCTEDHVCTSCDKVVLHIYIYIYSINIFAYCPAVLHHHFSGAYPRGAFGACAPPLLSLMPNEKVYEY